MILADVGNSYVHIWHDGRIEHLHLMEAIEKYGAKRVDYINVNTAHAQALATLEDWSDIAEHCLLEGAYGGMGIDRQALCLSHPDGIFIDAGSAITVDKVVNGVYQGGYILPGIHAYHKAYADISPVLDVALDKEVSLEVLPKSTGGSISYGTIAPIVCAVEKIRENLPAYCTGGDGAWMAGYVEQAVFDEALLFQGMISALRASEKLEILVNT